MHKGSCLCGAVSFVVEGDYYDIADGLPQNQQ